MKSATMELRVYKSIDLEYTKKKLSINPEREYMRRMRELEFVEAIKKQYQRKSVI